MVFAGAGWHVRAWRERRSCTASDRVGGVGCGPELVGPGCVRHCRGRRRRTPSGRPCGRSHGLVSDGVRRAVPFRWRARLARANRRGQRANGKRQRLGMNRVIMAVVLVCSAATAFAQPRAIYQQTQYKGQEIGKLTGDVYYARMDDYLSVFLVTPEGIVLVEPIGTEFATWLKGEIASRFKVPVKYVIYSHHHWDHGSGASVYADTARIIGHEAMMKRLAMPPADTPLPQNASAQDKNGNGRIEQEEAQGNLQTQFALYDDDRNGVLSGAEVARGPLAFVRPPDLTYRDPI